MGGEVIWAKIRLRLDYAPGSEAVGGLVNDDLAEQGARDEASLPREEGAREVERVGGFDALVCNWRIV
jgi:hypothetical protein